MRMPVQPAPLAPISTMLKLFWFMLFDGDDTWMAVPPVPTISMNMRVKVLSPAFCTVPWLDRRRPFLHPSISMFSKVLRHGMARSMPHPVFVDVNPPFNRRFRNDECQNDTSLPASTAVE